MSDFCILSQIFGFKSIDNMSKHVSSLSKMCFVRINTNSSVKKYGRHTIFKQTAELGVERDISSMTKTLSTYDTLFFSNKI